ncbi:hypothetical protein [Streptomyces kronopolitis]
MRQTPRRPARPRPGRPRHRRADRAAARHHRRGRRGHWLDGQQTLVPYGVHDFTHAPRDGEENWNFTDWRRHKEWHKDWRISHPIPTPDAGRWGLVPLSLHQMTSAKASFSLTEARDIMQPPENVQRARWRRWQ